jgi:hypothetical protein
MCENSSAACVTASMNAGPKLLVVESTTFSSAGSSSVRIVRSSGATCSPLPSRKNVRVTVTSSRPTSSIAGRARSKKSRIAFSPFALSVQSLNFSAFRVMTRSRSLPSGYACLPMLNRAVATSRGDPGDPVHLDAGLLEEPGERPALASRLRLLVDQVRELDGAACEPVDERPGRKRDVPERVREVQGGLARPADRYRVPVALRLEVAAPRARPERLAGLPREIAERVRGLPDDAAEHREVLRRVLYALFEAGEQALLRLVGQVPDRLLELIEFPGEALRLRVELLELLGVLVEPLVQTADRLEDVRGRELEHADALRGSGRERRVGGEPARERREARSEPAESGARGADALQRDADRGDLAGLVEQAAHRPRERLDARAALVEPARRLVRAGGELELLRLHPLRVALGLIERLLVLPERARIEVTAELRAELVTLRRAGADLVELAVVVRERPVVDLEPELLFDRLAGLLLMLLPGLVELAGARRVEPEAEPPENLTDAGTVACSHLVTPSRCALTASAETSPRAPSATPRHPRSTLASR